jgi:Arc/MetJ-type ribon-helix-helix transcriptional regulator
MAGSSRITVRVNGALCERLEQRCQQVGESVSEVVRSALELALGQEMPAQAPVRRHSPDSSAAPPGYVFPHELNEVASRYVAFGMEAAKERRRAFGAILAVSEVVRQNSGNPQDLALCVELLQLGTRFGLLIR